ncbi:MAG: ankyrin repeat domain-containing protein [Bacteriovoracales bacterium]|nr:ankyrin repeat domain-containing protein [Bacteriovoracales bacterium]
MRIIKSITLQVSFILISLFSFSAYADQELFQAVRGGNLERVETLLGGAGKRLPDAVVNEQDGQKKTALHWATADAHLSSDIAKALLAAGADPNMRDNHGWTPVNWALNYNRDDLVLLLGEFGADMDAAYEDGRTLLHHAWSDLDKTKLFIQAGADVNVVDAHGWKALHYAILNGQLEVAQELISAGTDVNGTDIYGFTPFHLAFFSGNDHAADLLVKAGADVNALDPHGNPILNIAVMRGLAGEVKALIGFAPAADANALDAQGYTPLTGALRMGRLDIAQILIDAGADVNLEDGHGVTPLYLASMYGYSDLVDSILGAGADADFSDTDGNNSLHKAAFYGYSDITVSLLKSGADPFLKNMSKETPLKTAKLQRKGTSQGMAMDPELEERAPYWEYLEVVKLLRKDMRAKTFDRVMKNKR